MEFCRFVHCSEFSLKRAKEKNACFLSLSFHSPSLFFDLLFEGFSLPPLCSSTANRHSWVGRVVSVCHFEQLNAMEKEARDWIEKRTQPDDSGSHNRDSFVFLSSFFPLVSLSFFTFHCKQGNKAWIKRNEPQHTHLAVESEFKEKERAASSSFHSLLSSFIETKCFWLISQLYRFNERKKEAIKPKKETDTLSSRKS